MSVVGKACIVTGATSGIGLAIARELAVNGADLLLVGRNGGKGNEIASSLRDAGRAASFVAADLADRSAPQRIVEVAVEAYGRIDVLVNNAGILTHTTVLDCTDEEWDSVIDVNLSAAFRLSRAVLAPMLEQRSGAIVNVASDWALMGARGATAYAVSKAALAQLTRCVALDYADKGIRVNAVCPGNTDTPMLEHIFPDKDRDWMLRNFARDIPMRRIARADEVAKVVAFLAGGDASFMTGSLVPVDGGTSAQ
ncbi:MAG TPA: SDR family NAD(P)-dependent oxidoreductase [Stellaceae bacterium]|nr:SDR family NAD(P)-dependent oxidoreductase [Stellaceae bacterium]